MNETQEPKKRGRKPDPNSPANQYFGKKEEEAIKLYLTASTAEEKNRLFEHIVGPALKELVKGILKMPKFQKLIGLNKEELEEDAYYHVIFNLDKFNPERVGKNGQLVKAFSYYGTIVKNYILGMKQEADKHINEHGGMLDSDEFADKIAENPDNSKDFEELKKQILHNLDFALGPKKLNKNDVIVGNTLKYMLQNWHRLEFQSKNEFVRLLCHYTQLKPPVVARSLKKFKLLAYDNHFKPNSKDKKKKLKKAKKKRVS